jgi:hypothetical protein
VAVVWHGAKIIQIDPWNRLEAARERDESETEYIGRCLRTLHVFAHDMNCHVQVLAHPAKMERPQAQGTGSGGHLGIQDMVDRALSCTVRGSWTTTEPAMASAGRARLGDAETARRLLDRGADVNATASMNFTPLRWAMGRRDLSNMLIDFGADVNALSIHGESPLHLAATQGSSEMQSRGTRSRPQHPRP